MFNDFQEFFYIFLREPVFLALAIMLLIGLILAVTTIVRAATPDDS